MDLLGFDLTVFGASVIIVSVTIITLLGIVSDAITALRLTLCYRVESHDILTV
jgi:hypothetical protein